jgi:hypothetical protein
MPRFPQSQDWGRPPLRLQKVVHRKPVPFRPHESEPDYLICFVIETLECGHQIHTFPQSDPLVAVRRHCNQCGSDNLIQFPAVKKKLEEEAA